MSLNLTKRVSFIQEPFIITLFILWSLVWFLFSSRLAGKFRCRYCVFHNWLRFCGFQLWLQEDYTITLISHSDFRGNIMVSWWWRAFSCMFSTKQIIYQYELKLCFVIIIIIIFLDLYLVLHPEGALKLDQPAYVKEIHKLYMQRLEKKILVKWKKKNSELNLQTDLINGRNSRNWAPR